MGEPMIRKANTGQTGVRPASSALGEQLRHMFDHVARDPMPEHLMELVDQLEDAYVAGQVARARELHASDA